MPEPSTRGPTAEGENPAQPSPSNALPGPPGTCRAQMKAQKGQSRWGEQQGEVRAVVHWVAELVGQSRA